MGLIVYLLMLHLSNILFAILHFIPMFNCSNKKKSHPTHRLCYDHWKHLTSNICVIKFVMNWISLYDSEHLITRYFKKKVGIFLTILHMEHRIRLTIRSYYSNLIIKNHECEKHFQGNRSHIRFDLFPKSNFMNSKYVRHAKGSFLIFLHRYLSWLALGTQGNDSYWYCSTTQRGLAFIILNSTSLRSSLGRDTTKSYVQIGN